MTERPARRPAVYTPVLTRRAFEGVADQIRQQLSSGALKPGDRLPSERELAEQFSLSRNTVREALRSLEMSGVLQFRKGHMGGAFVREGQSDALVSGFTDLFRLGVITPENLIEARAIVGVEVTRLACQRATEADLVGLDENVVASEAAAEAGDLKRRVETNLGFHALLARATGNLLLVILVEALIEVQSKLLEVQIPLPNSEVMSSRKRLMKHLHARDEEAAVAEMQTHLKALQKHYLSQDFAKQRRQAA
jgi:GntR family transcriptional repressor for pyruvate dehydrogenase complex